jgi:hypothetical protein
MRTGSSGLSLPDPVTPTIILPTVTRTVVIRRASTPTEPVRRKPPVAPLIQPLDPASVPGGTRARLVLIIGDERD